MSADNSCKLELELINIRPGLRKDIGLDISGVKFNSKCVSISTKHRGYMGTILSIDQYKN